MKTLKMRKKRLKFILMLVIISLVFCPYVKAEDDTPAEPPSSSDASSTEGAPEMQTLGGGMVTMGGSSWDPPPLPPPVSPSAIGGAFSSLMSESFKTDLATGAATLNIPIVVPPGRKNVQPNIALSYSSNNPNGICGVGWSIPVSAIQRSTKKGVPRYTSMEDFIAGGEELINIGGNEYRAKIESSFTKYVYISANNKWIAYDKSGTQYHFGSAEASRMTHPDYPNYIFSWYLDKVVDVYGNAMTYTYKYIDTDEGKSLYPEYIYYTSNDNTGLDADKRVEFIYESSERSDKIYNRRTGWSSTIKRRLEEIKVYINFDRDTNWGEEGEVVWTYNLAYWPNTESSTSCSLLKSIQLEDSGGNTLPAKTFTYQKLEP